MSDAQDDFSFGNDDGDNDDGSQSDPVAGTTNAENDKRIAQALHRAEKQLKDLEKKNQELEEFRKTATEKERVLNITGFATTLGLKPKQAELYAGEPTEEAFKQWAVDYGLVEIDGTPPTEVKDQGFVPGAPNATGDVQTMFTHEQIMEMLVTDPQRADNLLSQGRVALNKQE